MHKAVPEPTPRGDCKTDCSYHQKSDSHTGGVQMSSCDMGPDTLCNFPGEHAWWLLHLAYTL